MKHPTPTLLVCLALIAGCGDSSQPASTTSQPVAAATPAREVRMQLGTQTVTLEIADEPAERSKGLMFRSSLAADRGMIFVFPDEQERGFWMKNTYLPLDIIYIDAAKRIVSIKQMKPHDLSSTPSDGPAMFAIELNAGRAAQLGLSVGQVVDIPPAVTGSVR